MAVPLALMPPLASVGIAAASIGSKCLPDASTEISRSNERRLIIPSVVFAERIGLSVLGERCVAMRNVPASVEAAVSPTRVHAASAMAKSSAPKRRIVSVASAPVFWPRIFSPGPLV